MRTGRVVLLLGGLVLLLVGVSAAAMGSGLGWAHLAGRDAEGYVSTPAFALETDTYAVTAEHLEVVASPGAWLPWAEGLDLRLRVTPVADQEIFVGLGPEEAVGAYLADIEHEEVTELEPVASAMVAHPGSAPARPPAEEVLWTVSAQGSGTQQLDWQAATGEWALVIMNADGSPGLAVQADAGAHTGMLGPLALALLVGGLVVVAGGVAVVIAAVPHEPARVAAAGPAVAPRLAPRELRHAPVGVVGHLDPQVSRWLWLVKWLLLLPHLLVLVVLWFTFVVLTLVAGIATLLTGRYPPAIFAFNVGVLRWTWRVGFYGYSALGTDQYPPFTLADAEYPARLDVAYPARLSRGLVLVKSWLLALPHLLILAALTGGGATWTLQLDAERSWQLSLGGGLIGLLVLVAGAALLFLGRYPTGLFDLLMGLNRWVYRVVVYVALMTDDYPPFRLDQGGPEPEQPPPPPAPPSAAAPGRQPTPA